MTDTNNWLQEVEEVLGWPSTSQHFAAHAPDLLRQAVTMVKAQGADVLPPRVEPFGYVDVFGNFSLTMKPWMHDDPNITWHPVFLHPPSSSEPAGGEALLLAALMQGLEIPPTAVTLGAEPLRMIGAAIATQAKHAMQDACRNLEDQDATKD